MRSMIIAASAAAFAAAAAAEPLDIFWVGNSHTRWAAATGGGLNQGETPGIADMVGLLAVHAGYDAPNHHWSVINGAFLSSRAADSDNLVANGIPAGTSIDVLVLQGNSTESVPELGGDPTAFAASAAALDAAFRGHNAGVETVLYQTWARAAGHGNYAAQGGPVEDPQAYHDVTRASYHNAASAIGAGGGAARIAPVGDAFANEDWDTRWYVGDNNHTSREGGVLASAILFATIYGESVSDLGIDPSALNNPIDFEIRALGIDTDEWNHIAAVADAALVPAPGAGAGLVAFGLIAGRRRR